MNEVTVPPLPESIVSSLCLFVCLFFCMVGLCAMDSRPIPTRCRRVCSTKRPSCKCARRLQQRPHVVHQNTMHIDRAYLLSQIDASTVCTTGTALHPPCLRTWSYKKRWWYGEWTLFFFVKQRKALIFDRNCGCVQPGVIQQRLRQHTYVLEYDSLFYI